MSPTVAFVHFDLHTRQFHGVAQEQAKYERAFGATGWDVRTIAGAGNVTHLIPGMQRRDLVPDCPALRYEDLLEAFRGVDLAWVINLCSLPYNPEAAEMVVQAVTELNVATVFNHHDLPWEHGFDFELPVDPTRPWFTVVTSEFLRDSLARRGMPAHALYTAFELGGPWVDRAALRSALGVLPTDRLLVQPTRLDAQKNVLGGLRCALELFRSDRATNIAYWITGEPGVHARGPYLEELLSLARECADAGVRVLWGPTDHDVDAAVGAYVAADLVMFPSHGGEGFGLPPIEAAMRGRPVAVGSDPRVEAIRSAAGLEYLPLDAARIHDWFSKSANDRAMDLTENRRGATSLFSFDDFVVRLVELLSKLGLDDLVRQAAATCRASGYSHGSRIGRTARSRSCPIRPGTT